jgi:hypothetical protein
VKEFNPALAVEVARSAGSVATETWLGLVLSSSKYSLPQPCKVNAAPAIMIREYLYILCMIIIFKIQH